MSVCIVGHGRSLLGSGLGPEIDAHTTVVRFLHVHPLPIEGSEADLGLHTDAIIFKTTRSLPLWKLQRRPGELWKARWRDPDSPGHSEALTEAVYPPEFFEPGQQGADIMGLTIHCRPRALHHWTDELHRLSAASGYVPPRPGGVFLSRGAMAAILACELRPSEPIAFAGLDNLWAGSNGDYGSRVAFPPGEPKLAAHDFASERAIVAALAERHGITFSALERRAA